LTGVIEQAHAVFDIIDFALALDEGDDTEAEDEKHPRVHISGIKISMCYEEDESSLPYNVQLFIREMERKEKEEQGTTRVKVYKLHLPLQTLLVRDAVMSSANGDSEKPTMIAGLCFILIYRARLTVHTASVSKDMRNTLVEFAEEHSRAVDLVFTDYQP
jgi:hypothetical protein